MSANPEPRPCLPSGERTQAVVCREYGTVEVLRLEDVERCAPDDEQVLVAVRAAAANAVDWHYMRGTRDVKRSQSGLRKPFDADVGVDVAGVVVEIGCQVTRF